MVDDVVIDLRQPSSTDRLTLRRLAQTLQTVRRRCAGLPVLAIRWMHVKHPLHEVQEAFLRGTTEALQAQQAGNVQWVRQCMRCLLFGGLVSIRLVGLRLVMRRSLARLRRQSFDLIARTCCFGTDRAADGRDFYYGDLQQRFARRGIRMLVLCGDATEGDWRQFAKNQFSVHPDPRAPELCLIAWHVPLRMAIRQLASAWRLARMARQASDVLMREVARCAAWDCLAPDTLLNSLSYWVARVAVRRWRPRAYLTLYEGHAWEVCAWQGVKAVDSACRTVGYQHTAIFEESMALTEPAEEVGCRPEVVLCLGEIPMELLRAGHAPLGTPLLGFGTFRYQGAGCHQPADLARRTILVTPEGIASEIAALFTFAVACAERLPSHTFVLRCHPQIPMAEALRLVDADVTRHANIILSEGRSLEEDCARSSGLLYRGSSTVMYAILQGLRPIYLRVDALRDRDPVYGLTAWRQRCEMPEEFERLVRQDEHGSRASRSAEWDAAARYVRSYTEPVTDERIAALIEAIR